MPAEHESLVRTLVASISAMLLTGCVMLAGYGMVEFRGTSMLPTIKDGQRLHTLKLDQKTKADLKRGDVVVFRAPADQTKSYIKRIIALPGDRIEIRRGEVWLNGLKQSEPYLSDRLNVNLRTFAEVSLQPNAYYIMGDNRDNSADSRMFGPVSGDLIEAKVVLPLSE